MATIPLESHSSSLATYYKQAKDSHSRHDYGWDGTIDTITIHCYVGQVTAKEGCDYFAYPLDSKGEVRTVSANYVVGYDGSIGISVPENMRSACSSNVYNDARAVTIEVASDYYEPYKVHAAAYSSLIALVTDICLRNNIKQLVWSTNATERIKHLNGCNMTVHRDYATDGRTCPGTYLYNLHGAIATEVNRRLGSGQFGIVGTIDSIDSVINSRLSITEVKTTSLKAFFKLESNVDVDFSEYTYSYNLYKIAKNTGSNNLEETLIIKNKKFNISKDSAKFAITNLIPNTTYAVEILAQKLDNSTAEPFVITPKKKIITLQDYPKEVSNVVLTGIDTLNKSVYLTQPLTVQFIPTSDWGYWGYSNNCKKGYRLSLITNGNCIMYKDDLVQNTTEVLSSINVKIADLVLGAETLLTPNTSIQIGVQPWLYLANTEELIIDDSNMISSNSVFIRHVLPNVDKIYIKRNNIYKRIMLYINKKKGELFG